MRREPSPGVPPTLPRTASSTSSRRLTVGGPELAAQALRAALVDEIRLIVCPVVGGGKRFFPEGVRLNLEPLEERRFSGVVVLRCAVGG
jgi:dihydrofolate reductase